MLRHLMILIIGFSVSSTALAQDTTTPATTPSTTDTTAQAPPQTPPVQEPDQVVRPVETARTPSTVRKIMTNFLHDQKAIWTSPAHIDKDNVKWWVLFGAGTAALVGTDRTTSKALPSSGSQVSF